MRPSMSITEHVHQIFNENWNTKGMLGPTKENIYNILPSPKVALQDSPLPLDDSYMQNINKSKMCCRHKGL